jgi:hypothetical protein
MAQVVLKISDDVGRMPILLDGAHVVEFTDANGVKKSVNLTVSERGTKFAMPTSSGTTTLDKNTFAQLLRDAIEKDKQLITIDPEPVVDDKKTEPVPAETPWGLIVGAAVVGYLLGKNT